MHWHSLYFAQQDLSGCQYLKSQGCRKIDSGMAVRGWGRGAQRCWTTARTSLCGMGAAWHHFGMHRPSALRAWTLPPG